jgi:bifunctional enzyme CysN/CysC
VAPHDAVREKARQVIGAGRCVTVWLKAPVEVCRQRDGSGAYQLADTGKIQQFPGVTAQYEEPSHADLVLLTDQISVEESVERIVRVLKERGFVQ